MQEVRARLRHRSSPVRAAAAVRSATAARIATLRFTEKHGGRSMHGRPDRQERTHKANMDESRRTRACTQERRAEGVPLKANR